MKPPPPDSVEQAAAEWALRREQGLSPAEEAEFQAWLRSGERHGQVLAETEETARLLGSLRHRPSPEIPFSSAVGAPRRGFGWAAVAIAAVLAAAFLGWWRFRPASPLVQTVSTRVGERRTLSLPDGSVVLLNTDSVVREVYRPAERRIELLRGEAFFSVAKNPTRPFWVEAGGVAVRAVGTAFNVRLDEHGMNVLVTEGRVQAFAVQNPAAPLAKAAVTLGPVFAKGQLARVLSATAGASQNAVIVTAIGTRRIENLLAWKQGGLEFFETPLSDVVSEFNRYNRRRLVIVDPRLAARRFGGSFASPNEDGLIELLQQEFGVRAQEHGEEIDLSLRP